LEKKTDNSMPLSRYLLVLFLLLPMAPAWAEVQPPLKNIDPWESMNRKLFVFNDTLDKYLLKPVAKGYHYVMPDPAERGVGNFISNIYEVNSFFNGILQGQFTGAAYSGSRFMVNSTIGLLGFIDVATSMGIAQHPADFGQTLSVWGVGSGPFVMMPVIGPRTVRSTVGYFVDTYTSIPAFWETKYAWTFWTVEVIDYRARLLDAEDLMTGDRYIFMRDAYLSRRAAFVNRGVVQDDFSDYEEGEEDFEEF
jgi:phospholipid-binding lipoprotein MlaA